MSRNIIARLKCFLLILLLYPFAAAAQTLGPLQVLKSFGFPEGSGTGPNLPILSSDGFLYGTTRGGGIYDCGTLYRVHPDGTGYYVLYHFGSDPQLGQFPSGSLVEGSDGYLYGTTGSGGFVPFGSQHGSGTVFKIDRNGTGHTLLHRFIGAHLQEGSAPVYGVIEGSDDSLYGATSSGGSTNLAQFGLPVLYKLEKDGTGFQVLFKGATGERMTGPLFEAADGYLYFPAASENNQGLICRIAKTGGPLTIIKRFTEPHQTPPNLIIEGIDGAIYGAMNLGGSHGYGAIFTINKDGSDYSTLYNCAPSHNNDPRDQRIGLIRGEDDWLYGTSILGGTTEYGTLFKLKANGDSFQFLYTFNWNDGGALPMPGLLLHNATLYGVTIKAGPVFEGTLFNFSLQSDTYTVLHSFTRTGGDGGNPESPLVEGPDGILYGVFTFGQRDRAEGIFKISRNGSNYSILHRIPSNHDHYRSASLTMGRDGILYGISEGAGTHGIVFRFDPNRAEYRTLHEFDGTRQVDGPRLGGTLLHASDGLLYGITPRGGTGSVMYRLQTDGHNFTNLYRFSSPLSPDSTGIFEGSDGYIYGTATLSIFRIKKDGSGLRFLRISDVFTLSSLLEGSDGLFYGTTSQTVYRLKTNFSGFSTLHRFSGFGSRASLIEGKDGALYGTTVGAPGHWLRNDRGTVFRLNRDGSSFSVLHQFTTNNLDGQSPHARLLQASDGAFYGTTFAGGDSNFGTLFKIRPPGHLGITYSPSRDQMDLSVMAATAVNYYLQTTTNLAQPSWETLRPITTHTNRIFHTSDPSPPNSPSRFYRVIAK